MEILMKLQVLLEAGFIFFGFNFIVNGLMLLVVGCFV